jgi:polar amino acid transport system substrate-binding protein
MVRKTFPLVAATFFVLGLFLVACDNGVQETAPASQATMEEPVPAVEAAEEETQSEDEEPAADSELPDLGGREITIAVENAYLPFNYIDPDTGEPAGWDYEVWNEICALINCMPVFIETGWAGMIQAVAESQFDTAANGIAVTEERAEIVDYSEIYMNIDQRLLVRLDETGIDSIEDFVADESLVIGAKIGTKNHETVREYLAEERIDTVEQFPFAVRALIAGDTDAVIIDEVAGQGYTGDKANVLKLVGPAISSEQLGFIFPKGSDLVDPVNAALNELKANGFLQAINAQYFGPDFDLTHEDLY